MTSLVKSINSGASHFIQDCKELKNYSHLERGELARRVSSILLRSFAAASVVVGIGLITNAVVCNITKQVPSIYIFRNPLSTNSSITEYKYCLDNILAPCFNQFKKLENMTCKLKDGYTTQCITFQEPGTTPSILFKQIFTVGSFLLNHPHVYRTVAAFVNACFIGTTTALGTLAALKINSMVAPKPPLPSFKPTPLAAKTNVVFYDHLLLQRKLNDSFSAPSSGAACRLNSPNS